MFFDPRPKTKKEDLYDRLEELGQLFDALGYASMIVVTGLRRTGKTSFVNVALAECGCPYVVTDLRGMPYNPSHADLVRRLEASFRNIDRRWLSDLTGALEHLKGVSVLGNEVTFEWGKAGIDLTELFAKVDGWAAKKGKKFVVAFDEIQLIRGDRQMLNFFAHVIDSYRNIVVMATGSEVGLLFDFLGFDKPKSPLYGRHFVQIQMKNFSVSMAGLFLAEGFKQTGIGYTQELIDYAVKKLGGTPGWLTLFGLRCRDRKASSKELVDEVSAEAGKMAREEVMKMVDLSPRYAVILNFIARAVEANWSQIKSAVEVKEGRSITNHAISTLLKNLALAGIVSGAGGKYLIADPLLAEGIRAEGL